jgi:tRNA G37 N-methylase TrmD
MVLKPEPISAAMEELRRRVAGASILTPDGTPLTRKLVVELVQVPHLIFA